MNAEARDAIRQARDQATRRRLLETNAYEARRRRLMAACAADSPVRASNQVRAVMTMLDNAAKARQS